MFDNNLNGVLNRDEFKLFSEIYIINVLSDKVLIYENVSDEMKLKEETSFFNYMQQLSKNIYSEDLNRYFENLTINKINENGGSLSFNYKYKNEDGTYSDRINLVRVNNNNIIFVYVVKEKFNINTSEPSSKNDKIEQMSNSIADTVLKIYNSIDTTLKDNVTGKYITNLLDNLMRDFPEISSEFQKNITSQVNKTKDVLLIIDDDNMTRTLIKKTFKEKFDILEFKNGEEALNYFNNNELDNIVGIFLDLFMPVVDGFAVLDYLKSKLLLNKIPVIIISGTEDKEVRQKVYQYNIADLLEKPFNLDIINYRTNNLIKLYKTGNNLNNIVYSQHNDLIKVINRIYDAYIFDNYVNNQNIKKYLKYILLKVEEIYPSYKISTSTINKCLEAIDYYNVGSYILPRLLGRNGSLSEKEIKFLYDLSSINIIISDTLLLKKNDDDLKKVCNILSTYSNELYNGLGYPNKVKQNDIPIISQCVQFASKINLIFSNKNVKNISGDEIINKYFNNSNMTYNPDLIYILSSNIDQIKNI